MARVKGGLRHMQRRRKVMKLARGFRGMRGRAYRVAKQSVMKALMNAYIDRRRRKRDFRRLWIVRINAAARQHGLSYSQFVHGLKAANVGLNRKMLAEIAVRDESTFARLAALAKRALGATETEDETVGSPAADAA